MKTLLFVCTGNFYRSRLAELLFNHYAQEAGLDWKAVSRGLMLVTDHQGISPFVTEYLAEKGLGELAGTPRNPITVTVDELAEAGQVVLMNQAEHLPMMNARFSWMVRALESRNALKCWNIYDIPSPVSLFRSLMAPRKHAMAQPPESGLEHVDFAVQALVATLRRESVTL